MIKTIAQAKKAIEGAIAQQVEDGRLYAGVHLASFEWLGEWSEPVHGGPAFRCGRAVIADENGRAHPLAFTAESDGSWSIR
jgi:hypothetical protein